MNQSRSSEIDNTRKVSNSLRVPRMALLDSFQDVSRYNQLERSLVSADVPQLLNVLNKSSPEFTNNMFFNEETEGISNSPYKELDMISESHFKSVSRSRANHRNSFDKKLQTSTDYHHLISNENFAINMFESQAPAHFTRSSKFNCDESVFQIAEKGAIAHYNMRPNDLNDSVDSNLDPYRITKTNARRSASNPSLSDRCSISIQTKLKPLAKLFSLMVKVFTRREIIEADLMIPVSQLKIFNCILYRKFMKRLTSIELEAPPEIQLDRINSIINSSSHKRQEECYKFVFTRVLKFLKKKIKRNSKIKKNIEAQFYAYYFGEIAQGSQESIELYYYPLTKKGKKETLNSNYFDRIFQSKNFVNDMVKYLTEHLNEEYRAEIVQKLESLLLKWDTYFSEDEKDIDKYLEEIKNYLIKNKRCKLPWTIDEVKEAVQRVYSLIEVYSNLGLSIALDKSVLFQE